MENPKMNALIAVTRLADAVSAIMEAQAKMVNSLDNMMVQIQGLIVDNPVKTDSELDKSIFVEVKSSDVEKIVKPVFEATKPVRRRPAKGKPILADSIRSFMAGPPRQTGLSLAVALGIPNPKTSGVAQVTAFRRNGISSRSKYHPRCKKLMKISLEKNAQVRESLKLRPVEELFSQRMEEARSQGERQRLSRGLSVLKGDKNHARITNVWSFSQLDLKRGDIPRRKGVGHTTVNILQDVQDDLRLDMEAKFI